MKSNFHKFLKETKSFEVEGEKESVFMESLSKNDVISLKRFTLSENAQVSVPALVSLLLLETNGKRITDEEVETELKVFGYLDDESGKVSKKGKDFLKEAATKERVTTILYS